MLRVNKLTDYATIILCHIAKHPEQRYSAVDIAEAVHIAHPTVSKILKVLTQAQIVSSHRGVLGGYSLAHEAEHITMAHVIRAMEGPIAVTECSIQSGLCDHEASCAVSHNWQKINQAILMGLNEISIVDMNHTTIPNQFDFQSILPIKSQQISEGGEQR